MKRFTQLTAALLFAAAVPLTAQDATPSAAATPAPAATQTAPASTSFTVDSVHSFIVFGIGHMGVGQVWGTFEKVEGTIEFDPANLENSKINLVVAIDSIHTNNAQRDTHLKSADFFDVEQFPTATFTSEKIEALGDKKYRVTGTLDMHGVKKPVSGEVTYASTVDARSGGVRVGGQTTLTLDRTEWGMDGMVGPAGKDVTVIVAIEATSQRQGGRREGMGQGQNRGQRRGEGNRANPNAQGSEQGSQEGERPAGDRPQRPANRPAPAQQQQ